MYLVTTTQGERIFSNWVSWGMMGASADTLRKGLFIRIGSYSHWWPESDIKSLEVQEKV